MIIVVIIILTELLNYGMIYLVQLSWIQYRKFLKGSWMMSKHVESLMSPPDSRSFETLAFFIYFSISVMTAEFQVLFFVIK